MGNDRLKHLQVVKDFFCLDEPPTYSESMEECRVSDWVDVAWGKILTTRNFQAIFEAQEETITHLKIQLNGKEQTIESLEQKLKTALLEKDAMEKAMRYANSPFAIRSFDLNVLSVFQEQLGKLLKVLQGHKQYIARDAYRQQ